MLLLQKSSKTISNSKSEAMENIDDGEKVELRLGFKF